MFWRIKNWTKRTIWRLACGLARTQGVNLNRAIYVGPGRTVLTWDGEMMFHNIKGAEVCLRFDEGVITTVFGANQ